ncbi:hypothetical protein G6F57_006567 [Rhizopus arrhizus]|nr:hypothetical protein G6F30_007622 [Rhizopus arrhizus]KAG1414220.1 hypothetical protein G6F58_007064 [Rhizopus delemar]KAG0980225.1 hypothetical protein G6F29_007981 [Rhizopus arrhizus]KAG0992754.1 hypothetical protein G6F28_007337 [Rhizopus arrhizus]KAG1006712.1 hypothetical protein G6F27_008046 [Rhizopus arrhizus]
MIFDRYRNKSKRTEEKPTKKPVTSSSLANALLKRFQLSKKSKHSEENKNKEINHQPRASVSLPNINTIINNKDEPILSKSTVTLPRQRKRYSADQQPRHKQFASLKDTKVRHSFTFGHLSKFNHSDTLTLADLSLDPKQRAKLDKLTLSINTKSDDPQTLLSKVGSSNPPLTPHRSISHQHLQIPTSNLYIPSLNRTHSESRVKTQGIPIRPDELVKLLEEACNVTLIDVRNLMDYQKRRIRGSLNVNLPSLLIKRYQRGTVSNFNLENFITTSEGRDEYQQKQQEQVSLKKKVWVVYDEDMSEEDQTSQAWTLLKVLEKFTKNEGKVYYLSGGFHAFEDIEEWIESSAGTTHLIPQQQEQQHHYYQQQQQQQQQIILNNNNNTKLNYIPRRSVSYTIGDSKNHRRTSLFSLDTQAARVNNANALARRAKRRSELQQQEQQAQPVQPQPNLNRVNEDEELGLMTASPRTETEFSFIISEIIRGFLYVGPEIETKEQANQLEARSIKRVLNMAEECQDEGLGSNVIYHKVAARDTVEMKNIELVMMQAVHFIEEAKRNHEPIYVHCKAGKSRSITAILAYLVTSEKWTLKQAYRHVIKARPTMSPNIGFITELMKMENRVHGRVSSFLETDWQSSTSPNPEYAKELCQLEKAWQDNNNFLISSE